MSRNMHTITLPQEGGVLLPPGPQVIKQHSVLILPQYLHCLLLSLILNVPKTKWECHSVTMGDSGHFLVSCQVLSDDAYWLKQKAILDHAIKRRTEGLWRYDVFIVSFFLSMDKSLFSWKEHILYIYIHWRSPHSLYTLTLNIWWCSIFNISFCSLIRSILQDIYRRIEFNVLYLSSYEDLKSHGKKAVMKEIYLNKFEVDVSYSDDLFLYKIFIKNYTSLS